ncbi:MAG TPA: aminoacyl-tRNA hydrolase [Candidatus Paceibacterota bacterium]
MQQNKLIIIGLGNPGEDYARTYHNVGHLFIDYLTGSKKQLKNAGSFLFKDDDRCIFIKTSAYMNESGGVVKAILKRFHTLPINLLVVHDDSDIKIGIYKLSEAAGAAGHKGVESIIHALGGTNFKRLRIGIRPQEKRKTRLKAGEFVLRKISTADLKLLHLVFSKTMRNVIEKLV